MQHTEVMNQFKLSISGIKGEEEFLSFVSGNKWPEHVETVIMKLLRLTSIDSEIESNMGNDNHIIPTLLKILRRFDPGLSQKYNDSLSQQKWNKDARRGKNS